MAGPVFDIDLVHVGAADVVGDAQLECDPERCVDRGDPGIDLTRTREDDPQRVAAVSLQVHGTDRDSTFERGLTQSPGFVRPPAEHVCLAQPGLGPDPHDGRLGRRRREGLLVRVGGRAPVTRDPQRACQQDQQIGLAGGL